MERFYDGDQEKLFAEARVVNPFRKGPLINRNQSCQSSLVYKILYHFCGVYVTYKNMINMFKTFSPEELQRMVRKNVGFVLPFSQLQYVYK